MIMSLISRRDAVLGDAAAAVGLALPPTSLPVLLLLSAEGLLLALIARHLGLLRPILGQYYLFDPQPFYAAVWQVANECHHVEGLTGVQYYRHKEHRSEAFLAKEEKESAKKTK